MKYLAALCYALAIAGGSGALLNSIVIFALVFVAVVATLLALDHIIRDAVRPPPSHNDPLATSRHLTERTLALNRATIHRSHATPPTQGDQHA